MSSSVSIQGRGQAANIARDATAAIDRVHRAPPMPAVKTTHTTGRGVGGSYRFMGNRPVEIAVNIRGSAPRLSFAHEVGHMLDHQALTPGKGFATRAGAEVLSDFRETVKGTRAYKALEEMRDSGVATFRDAPSMKLPRSYRNYVITDEEIFARAYSQLIAVESGDATLLRELAEFRRVEPVGYQWDDDDFEPVRDALKRLFRGLGWMD